MSDWADEKAREVAAIPAAMIGDQDPYPKGFVAACNINLGYIAAALRQARADALEEAARVAEAFPAHIHGNLATAPPQAAEQAADEIAAAIRSLKDKQP